MGRASSIRPKCIVCKDLQVPMPGFTTCGQFECQKRWYDAPIPRTVDKADSAVLTFPTCHKCAGGAPTAKR